MAAPRVTVRGRHATLERHGIAAERFPAFVNPVLDLHGVDVVLLTFVLDGTGHHVVDGVDHEIGGPSFAITRSGETHGLVTTDGPLEVVNVYLDIDAHRIRSLEPPLDLAFSALLPTGSAAVRLPQVALDDLAGVRAVLDQLVRETDDPGAGTGEAMDALRRLLLIHCARAIRAHGFLPERVATGRSRDAIEAVRAHLDRAYVEPHTLASLAAMAHMERTYFSRMFAAHVGVTVTEYLTELRIRYAATQLRSSERPVGEIAAASGFRDLSHFGRMFRRVTGTTPRAFRSGIS